MIGVKLNPKVVEKLFKYYVDQIYKLLNLFEEKDIHGYKYAIRIRSELEYLPLQIPKLNNDIRFNVVLLKLDSIIEELIFLEADQGQFVKNQSFESMNLLKDIGRDM